jgi:hypothetical protein
MLFLPRIRLTAGNTFTINPINQTSQLINELGYTLPFTTFESEGSTSSLVRCFSCFSFLSRCSFVRAWVDSKALGLALSYLTLSDSCAFTLTDAMLMIKS